MELNQLYEGYKGHLTICFPLDIKGNYRCWDLISIASKGQTMRIWRIATWPSCIELVGSPYKKWKYFDKIHLFFFKRRIRKECWGLITE